MCDYEYCIQNIIIHSTNNSGIWKYTSPPFTRFVLFFFQSNTYQAALVTDGSATYTVYIYECGELMSMGGRIGYFINSNNFLEHPLSMAGRAQDIACENQPLSPLNNVVYRLSSAST